MPRDPKLDEEGLALHLLVVNDNPTASARVFEAYYMRVLDQMRKVFAWCGDEDVINNGTFKAFENYLGRPAQYLPEKRSLCGYLNMAAHGDIRNELERRGRYQRTVQPFYADVADGDDGAEYEREPVSDSNVEAEVMLNLHPLWARIDALVPDPVDRHVVRMMLDGERETVAYAELMGISHLPRAEQEREVKKCKDRLTKKLKRNLDPEEVRHDD